MTPNRCVICVVSSKQRNALHYKADPLKSCTTQQMTQSQSNDAFLVEQPATYQQRKKRSITDADVRSSGDLPRNLTLGGRSIAPSIFEQQSTLLSSLFCVCGGA